jgi:hypothetical protein
MRFSIRDLLWLTVVAVVGVSWWLDRQRLATQIRFSAVDLSSLPGLITPSDITLHDPSAPGSNPSND